MSGIRHNDLNKSSQSDLQAPLHITLSTRASTHAHSIPCRAILYFDYVVHNATAASTSHYPNGVLLSVVVVVNGFHVFF